MMSPALLMTTVSPILISFSLIISILWSVARETVEPQMRAVDPACGVHFQRISAYPGLLGRGAHGLQSFCCGLTGIQQMITLSFGTEGGLFEAMDIPAIVCGPGSIEQAHRPDEWIELDQLARCDQFMQDLLAAVAAPGFKLD